MLTFTKPPSNIYSRYVPSGYFVSMLNQAIQRVIFMHIFISYRFGSSDMFLLGLLILLLQKYSLFVWNGANMMENTVCIGQ